MKICLIKQVHLNTWLSSFIYHVMTEHTVNANDWKKVFNLSDEAPTEVDVRVNVNGVEVPFESFIKALEESYEKMLEEKAKEIIESNFESLISTLTEMQEDAKNKLAEITFPSWKKAETNE